MTIIFDSYFSHFNQNIMNIKYYKIIVKGNDKIGGVLYAPDNWPYPIAKDGEEVKNWNTLIVKLRDGEYRPFHLCIGGANLVNQEMKELFETYIKNNDDIEFLPVKTVSEIYGDRIYYIMHFKKIFDVIDRKKTIYVEGTDSILKLRLDYDKVKSLNIFNSQPVINDIIVSEQVKKSIKKNKLDLGIEFMPLYCGIYIMLKEKIEYWLNQINAEASYLPTHIVAFNFGLFETENGYGIYLIGSNFYDEHDDDWACNIDFEPKNKYLNFNSENIKTMKWEEFQNEVKSIISKYISTNINQLPIFKGKVITIGFDDGNLVKIR